MPKPRWLDSTNSVSDEPGTLQFRRLSELLHVRSGASLKVLAADWQAEYLANLDTPEGQAAVEPHVETADLILIDNRSCLFDSEGEKDPTAWQPAQEWLLSLRRRGKAVLMAHHANRQGGARGHSKSEDPLNLIIKLARPDDYSADQGSRFVLTFEKCRGAYGAAVAPFTAALTTDGWRVEGSTEGSSLAGKLRDYTSARQHAGDRVRSASEAVRAVGGRKTNALRAWGDLLKAGEIVEHPEGGFCVV